MGNIDDVSVAGRKVETDVDTLFGKAVRFGIPRLAHGGLLSQPDFVIFWIGQSVSLVGSQITLLALPLTAVMVLGAGPAQMGILGALGTLPWLILGLPAGVWVDRRSRRPIMIASDLGRFLVLLTVPLSAVTGLLTIELLYAVTLVTGILSILFSVAYSAYLPELVDKDRLVEANSKLELSRSAAELVGPGAVGILVQLVAIPITVLADALSFVVSALSITAIKTQEPAPRQQRRPDLRREMKEGLEAVLRHPLLRPMVTAMASMNVFVYMGLAAYTVFAVRELGLNAWHIGLVYSLGSLGFFVGASLAPGASARFGLGRAVLGGALLAGLSEALIPMAGGPTWVIVAILVAAQGLNAAGVVVGNVTLVSLRQTVTPLRLQGRVAGTSRVLSWGARVVGSLIGGMLAESIGLRSTLVVAALGQILAVGLLFFSPIRELKASPGREEDTATPEGQLA